MDGVLPVDGPVGLVHLSPRVVIQGLKEVGRAPRLDTPPSRLLGALEQLLNGLCLVVAGVKGLDQRVLVGR